jgi:hypothetical protein
MAKYKIYHRGSMWWPTYVMCPISEAKTERSWLEASLGKGSMRLYLKKQVKSKN